MNTLLKQMPYQYLFVLLFIYSCKTVTTDDHTTTIKVDINAEDVSIPFEDYFKSQKEIILETNKNSLFSKIDRISLYDHKIFILDKKIGALLVFKEEDGSFLYKIKNIGYGPGEYISLMDFSIDEKNKTIILHSDKPNGLYIHNLDGSFIKKIQLENYYSSMATLDDKILFFTRDTKREYLLFGYDTSKEKEEGYLKMNNRDLTYLNLDTGNPNLVKDKNIHFTLPYSEIVYEQNNDGIIEKYHIDYGDRKIPEDIYDTKDNLSKLMDYAYKNNYAHGVHNFREYKNYIAFSNRKRNLILYSKKEKTTQIVYKVKSDNMLIGNYIAHNGSDDKIIFQYPAMHFKKQMRLFQNVWDKVPERIKKIDSIVKDYDNPILLIYEFK